MRLESGTAVVLGRFDRTVGNRVLGLGPVACQPPKYFPISRFASPGVTAGFGTALADIQAVVRAQRLGIDNQMVRLEPLLKKLLDRQ